MISQNRVRPDNDKHLAIHKKCNYLICKMIQTGLNITAKIYLVTGLEITGGHHCGGETIQSISAKNTLKSLSSTVMTARYFQPCCEVLYNSIYSYMKVCPDTDYNLTPIL